MRTKALNYD
jgi:DNA replicative helicase MCM subunit Mcm2 (Cdc46/Mcm family)